LGLPRLGKKEEDARVGLHRCATAAVLMGVALTLAACERPFTRNDARAVPHSAIQVGEYRDKDWEYVDEDGATQKLKRCEDNSVWNTAYRCISPDGTVELTFNQGKRGMSNVILHTDDEDVSLDCLNDGSGGQLRFCMPISITPGSTKTPAS
jgi:hypothetical protein